MLSKNIRLKSITTIKWYWEQNEFSFLEKPRANYGFLTVEKGTVDYILEDRIITLKEGCFIYIPKNSMYKARFHIGEGEVKTLLVNFDYEEGEEIPITPFFNGKDDTRQIEMALKRLNDLEGEKDSIYLKQAYFYLCLHIIYSNYQSSLLGRETELIIKAKELLQTSELSLEEISERLKISPSGLRQKFKDAVGVSPSKWRNEKRILLARELLLTTDLSIDEIAQKTGFYDTPYFYKKFLDTVGMPPKKYRLSEKMF